MSDALARAEARRAALAAFGLLYETPYGRLTMRVNAAGTVDYEGAQILLDGRELPPTRHTGAVPADWPATYVFVFYGVFGPAPAVRLALPGIPAPQLPRLPFGDPTTNTPEEIESGVQLLWATVRYGTSAVYGVRREHPDGTVTESLEGLHLRHNKTDRDRAYQGLAWLRKRVQGKQSTVMPADEFLHDCQEAALYLRLASRSRGTVPVLTAKALYEQLGWGRSRFFDLMGEYRNQGHAWAANSNTLLSRLNQYVEGELQRRRQSGTPDR